jgi:NitT/TauT family transport system ATP-binding protein
MELQRIHQQQHKTVLFVTHDIEEAALLSDRVFVMSAGPGRVEDHASAPAPHRDESGS